MITKIYEINEHKTYEDLSFPALTADDIIQKELEKKPHEDAVLVDDYSIEGFNIETCKELAAYGYNVYCQQFVNDYKQAVYTVGIIDPNRQTDYPHTGSLLVDSFPLY